MTSNTAFECLSVSCGGTGQQWPATRTGVLAAADQPGMCGMWAPPQRYGADNPQMGEQVYQRSSHTVVKVLGPATHSQTWGSGQATESPQGTCLWRPVDLITELSRDWENRLEEHKQNFVCARTQEKAAVTRTRDSVRHACEWPGVPGEDVACCTVRALNTTVLD